MAKIDRKTQRIFGGGLSAEPNGISQFGSLANGAAFYSLDPAVIQALDAWWSGWLAAVVGKKNPGLEDMNAIFYVITRQLAYLLQQGIAEWDTDTVYYTNSFCTSGGATYRSVGDDNQGNDPTTATAEWQLMSMPSYNNPSLNVGVNATALITVNDLEPTGWRQGIGTLAFSGSPAGEVSITGIKQPVYAGQVLRVINFANLNIKLDYTNTANSAVGNRFAFSPAADITIAPGKAAELMYYAGAWSNLSNT